MIQLVVEGVFLDLYETDPPKITLAFDSFESFMPQSSYSQTFRVPATDHNYQFFKSAYEINGLDFDVTIRRDAQILVDGQEYMFGELRLNKIFKSIDNKIDYEVFFLGNTRNLLSNIGSKTLNQLDLTDFNHTASIDDIIEKSWNAFPAFGTYDGLDLGGDTLPGDIIYPLIDFGNTYDDDFNPEQVLISVGTGSITDSQVPFVDKLYTDRFRPMIRVNALLKAIFKDAGYRITGNILNGADPLFWRTYVSAWGNEAVVSIDPETQNLAKITLPEVFQTQQSATKIPFSYINYDYNQNWDSEDFNYVVPTNGAGNYSYSVVVFFEQFLLDPAGETKLRVTAIENGTPVNYDVNTYTLNGSYVYTVDGTINLDPGDSISVVVECDNSYVNITNATFRITSAPGIINVASLLDNEYKQIDFLKDIVKKFKLVIVPDRFDNELFYVDTWDNYIGGGNVYDWTSKLDLSKDLTIEPLFYEQPQTITFSDSVDKDWLNDVNDKNFKETFGTLNLDTDNALLSGDKKVEAKLAPTPVTEVQGANSLAWTSGDYNKGGNNFIIPQMYQLETKEKEDGTVVLLKNPIKPKTRLLFYNGQVYTGKSSATSCEWYYNDGNLSTGFKDYYASVTPYATAFNPFNGPDYTYPLTLDLNWQVENGYLRFNELPERYSVYDAYWKNYINLIYNKYSRRLIANFVLSAEDLSSFNFDDVIFVKDTYFFVEKIENIPLGEKASVKASLIKLNDYLPDGTGFIPLGANWEDIDLLWENITDNWEQL